MALELSIRPNVILISLDFPLLHTKLFHKSEFTKLDLPSINRYSNIIKNDENNVVDEVKTSFKSTDDRLLELVCIRDLICYHMGFLNGVPYTIKIAYDGSEVHGGEMESGSLNTRLHAFIEKTIDTMLHKKDPHKRPSWYAYFMQMALISATRTNCIKRGVGCVIVKENRVLGTGYNGTPFNTPNCFEGACTRCADTEIQKGEQLDVCICIHAEANALAETGGRSVACNSDLYVTLHPCISCAKLICQYGIKNVYYIESYSAEHCHSSRKLFSSKKLESKKTSFKL